MKSRLLIVAFLAATAAFATRCSGNGGGADASVTEPPDAALVDPGDTGPRPCDPKKCAEGNICVQNRCMLACSRHYDCPDDSYDCRAVEGQQVCVQNGMPIGQGQFGYLCGSPNATCADGFRCQGTKSDPTAYCTRAPCADDSECPGSYYCAEINVPAPTYDGGIPDTGPTPDTGTRPRTVKACLKRGFCAPAAGLVDCANGDALFAKDSANRGWCLKTCSGLDRYGCGAGNECIPTGADGGFECWPRSKTCAPEKAFCGRCTSSLDCPEGGFCYVYPTTKERMCLTECSNDSECVVPNAAPDRMPGFCETENNQLCLPVETGFSFDPGPFTCWYDACAPEFAGCKAADFVDARSNVALRKINSTITVTWQQVDGGVGDAGDYFFDKTTYTPRCLKIIKGQRVTFGIDHQAPAEANMDPSFKSFGFAPLGQACGPTFALSAIEGGTSGWAQFDVPGLYGIYSPLDGERDGKGMAAAILVVP